MALFNSQNVFSGYKTSNVLQGVSLQINSGEMVAVIGRNGVGKTTFIKTIIGLIEIRSGEIFFDEKRLNNLESFERAKLGIGYVRFYKPDDWPGRKLILELVNGDKHSCDIVNLPFFDHDKKIAKGLDRTIPKIP